MLHRRLGEDLTLYVCRLQLTIVHVQIIVYSTALSDAHGNHEHTGTITEYVARKLVAAH